MKNLRQILEMETEEKLELTSEEFGLLKTWTGYDTNTSVKDALVELARLSMVNVLEVVRTKPKAKATKPAAKGETYFCTKCKCTHRSGKVWKEHKEFVGVK